MPRMKRALIFAVLIAAVFRVPSLNSQDQTIRQYQLERDGKAFRLAMKSVPRPALAGPVRCWSAFAPPRSISAICW